MSEVGSTKGAAASPGDLSESYRRDAKHWQAQWEAAHWERAEIRCELDASRAREAKLVEALRECVMCARHSWPPLVDFDALLAPYDTPAVQMPSDCHPEGQ